MSRPRVPLDAETRGMVLYLLADIRNIYRDARLFPECAADLIPYAEFIREKVRLLRAGYHWHLNEYAWPVIDYPTHGHPEAPR